MYKRQVVNKGNDDAIVVNEVNDNTIVVNQVNGIANFQHDFITIQDENGDNLHFWVNDNGEIQQMIQTQDVVVVELEAATVLPDLAPPEESLNNSFSIENNDFSIEMPTEEAI